MLSSVWWERAEREGSPNGGVLDLCAFERFPRARSTRHGRSFAKRRKRLSTRPVRMLLRPKTTPATMSGFACPLLSLQQHRVAGTLEAVMNSIRNGLGMRET